MFFKQIKNAKMFAVISLLIIYSLLFIILSSIFKSNAKVGYIFDNKLYYKEQIYVESYEVVDSMGADVVRTYVLFMGDYEQAAPWSEDSVKGCKRFVDRIWNLLKNI